MSEDMLGYSTGSEESRTQVSQLAKRATVARYPLGLGSTRLFPRHPAEY